MPVVCSKQQLHPWSQDRRVLDLPWEWSYRYCAHHVGVWHQTSGLWKSRQLCLDRCPPLLVFLKLWHCFPAHSWTAVSHLSMCLLPCLVHAFLFTVHPDPLSCQAKPSLLSHPSLCNPHPHPASLPHCLLITCTSPCPPV